MEEKQKLRIGNSQLNKIRKRVNPSLYVRRRMHNRDGSALPDKHQANPLPVRLGGEEGTEEFSFGLFADSGTIVYDFYKSGGSGPYRYFALLACRFSGALYTFGSILNDIYQNLLEQRSIQTHLPYFGVAFQTENNVTVIAHSSIKRLHMDTNSFS